MLATTVKVREGIHINLASGETVIVKCLRSRGSLVTIGIDAPIGAEITKVAQELSQDEITTESE